MEKIIEEQGSISTLDPDNIDQVAGTDQTGQNFSTNGLHGSLLESPLETEQYWEVNDVLRAIDTVKVRRAYYLSDPTCGGLLKRRMNEKENGFKLWQSQGLLETRSGAKVHAHYLPWTKEGDSYLSLSFSVPKLIQGNNFTNPSAGLDIIAAINAELCPIFEKLKLPPEDVSQWEIRRIDFGLNFQVGKDVSRYLAYASTRTIPSRERCDHNNARGWRAGVDRQNNGVCFYSATVQTELYDKHKECNDPQAVGILRMEVSFRDAKAVRKLLGPGRSRLVDLTTDLPQKVLNKYLTMLGLDREIVGVRDIRQTLYEKSFSTREINSLMGFIELERRHPGLTPKELSAEKDAHLTGEAIRRYRRILAKAGVSYAEDEMEGLPALTLNALDEPPARITDPSGCGEMDAEDGKTSTSVPRNTPPDPSLVVPVSVPKVIAFLAAYEHILSSEFFGTPAIVVELIKQEIEDDPADEDLIDTMDESIEYELNNAQSNNAMQRETEVDWLSLDDDYIVARFRARYPRREATSDRPIKVADTNRLRGGR